MLDQSRQHLLFFYTYNVFLNRINAISNHLDQFGLCFITRSLKLQLIHENSHEQDQLICEMINL